LLTFGKTALQARKEKRIVACVLRWTTITWFYKFTGILYLITYK